MHSGRAPECPFTIKGGPHRGRASVSSLALNPQQQRWQAKQVLPAQAEEAARALHPSPRSPALSALASAFQVPEPQPETDTSRGSTTCSSAGGVPCATRAGVPSASGTWYAMPARFMARTRRLGNPGSSPATPSQPPAQAPPRSDPSRSQLPPSLLPASHHHQPSSPSHPPALQASASQPPVRCHHP